MSAGIQRTSPADILITTRRQKKSAASCCDSLVGRLCRHGVCACPCKRECVFARHCRLLRALVHAIVLERACTCARLL
eukprot:1561482-Pleurochrysis_carterae.AAC.1